MELPSSSSPEFSTSHNLSTPIPTELDKIPEFLLQNGITVKLSTIKQMSITDFQRKTLNAHKYNNHQRAILQAVRDLLKSVKRRSIVSKNSEIDESRMPNSMDESATPSMDVSSPSIRPEPCHTRRSLLTEKRQVLTDEKLEEKLKEHGLNGLSLHYIESMGMREFTKFLTDNNFSNFQKDLLKQVRKRIKIRLASARYLSKNKKNLEKTRLSSCVNEETDQIQDSEILERHNLTCYSLDFLENMGTYEFRSFLAKKEFSEEQKEVLKQVRKKLKSKDHTQEASTSSGKEDSSVSESKKRTKGQKTGTAARAVKKELKNVLKRSSRRQKPDMNSNPKQGLDDMKDASEPNEDHEMASISSNQEDLPSSSQEDATGSPVNVQNLIVGGRIFVKDSTVYPGHSYIYQFRCITQKDDAESDELVDVYECASCKEAANHYQSDEAREYVMNSLKTVKVSNGRIVEGECDGTGHVCVPLELIRKRYNME